MICAVCGNSVIAQSGRGRPRKYCSRECGIKSYSGAAKERLRAVHQEIGDRDECAMTHEEIAAVLGCTANAVGKVERIALGKLAKSGLLQLLWAERSESVVPRAMWRTATGWRDQ